MLKSLTVINYALIDQLSITFENGFSAITGETGAGKSILIGALSLILGKRADTSVLKNKTTKCIVEGVFDVSKLNLKYFFDHYDLDYYSSVIVRREILNSGKTRAFINDTPVNLNILKELGAMLVDIHSQHQTLMLGDNLFQLETLDSYLKLKDLKDNYRKIYKKYSEIKKELSILLEKENESKREEDYLRFQLEEFETVLLDSEQVKETEERLNFLTHASEVTEMMNELSLEILENEFNILDKLSIIIDNLNSVSEFYPKAGEFSERLDSVRIELKDLAEEAGRIKTDTEFNPAEIQTLEETLDKIYRLQQKHRVNTIEKLIEVKNSFEEKLLGIKTLETRINELSKELTTVKNKLAEKSAELTLLRKKGAGNFSESIIDILHKLGMKNSVFKVNIEELENYSENGKDKITFLFSSNKGVQPDEISKVASGGELSRLMLTIKSLITENSLLPTVVFDEIDTGVSGDIAGKTGNIMKEMSKHHQLIVITHLPQIAAKADIHYKVYKENKTDMTATNISILNDDERITEIAAMLSDEKITDAAKSAAKELLN